MVQKGVTMLRAISLSAGRLILSVDDQEVWDLDLPDYVLTEEELSAVRAVRPSALPGYPCYVPPVEPTNEPDQL